MRPRRSHLPPAGTLDPSEWDFRKEKVDDDELEPCFVYEHARELAKRSQRLATLIAQWKTSQHADRQVGEKARSESEYLLGECFDTTVTIDETFPDTAWQKLSEAEKAEIAARIRNEKLAVPDKPLAIKLFRVIGVAPNLRAFRDVHGAFRDYPSATDYGFIAIDWSFPKSKIQTAFERWLRANERVLGVKKRPVSRKTRGSFRDRLRNLGSMRLLKHHGSTGVLSDPTIRSSKIRFEHSPHKYLPDVYYAKAKAEKLINWLLNYIDSIGVQE